MAGRDGWERAWLLASGCWKQCERALYDLVAWLACVFVVLHQDLRRLLRQFLGILAQPRNRKGICSGRDVVELLRGSSRRMERRVSAGNECRANVGHIHVHNRTPARVLGRIGNHLRSSGGSEPFQHRADLSIRILLSRTGSNKG
jgi:hypothetical protein